MIIPENKIEEIRAANNIVDIIGQHVQLKKRGRNYIGLCPFHQEKTGSFTVSPEKQIYHCFGCHAGGNVYKFLMDYENISFVEAAQDLAARAGIVLEQPDAAQQAKQSEQETLYDINVLAARYFSNTLLKLPEGETGRAYFKKRGIKLQTIRTFGLGWAADSWDSFLNYSKSNGIDLELSRQLGLLDKSDSGKYYDKFRARVIFPIFSPNGRVIAFGGRVLEKSEKTAKYLNSPESIVYSKRKSLYGLFHSKEEIRKLDKAILVEGYMDLISLFQSGIKNVVASSGTALTEEQVSMLSRYTKNICVIYDADQAGIKASLRSIEMLLKQDFEIKIAELPEGEDPDSFVKNSGREAFYEEIGKAKNFLEYQSAQYEKQGKFADPVLQTESIRALVHSASFVKDELKRSLLLKMISKKFNLREALITSEMEKAIQNEKTSGKDHYSNNSTKSHKDAPDRSSNTEQHDNKGHTALLPVVKETAPDEFPQYYQPYDTDISINGNELENFQGDENTFFEEGEEDGFFAEPQVCPSEKDLIKLLFEGNSEVIKYIFRQITPEDFSTAESQYIAERVYEACAQDENLLPASLIEKIDDPKLKQLILQTSLDKYELSSMWEKVNHGLNTDNTLMKTAIDGIKRLRLFRIDQRLEALHNMIIHTDDDDKALELMKQKNMLLKERKETSQ
jgi:DNA primase